MGVMKNSYIDIVDRIVKETGYGWSYVANKFNESLDHDISPVDFFDDIVDSHCFGEV